MIDRSKKVQASAERIELGDADVLPGQRRPDWSPRLASLPDFERPRTHSVRSSNTLSGQQLRDSVVNYIAYTGTICSNSDQH